MKTVEIKMVLTMPDETYSSEEFKEFKDSILSGEMQRELSGDGNKLKITKCKITMLELK